MGAKYVSGSMQGAGSLEKSRLFSFTRSSICCSPAPTLFTDSCHYLCLMRSIQFPDPHCSQKHGQQMHLTRKYHRKVFQSTHVVCSWTLAETNVKMSCCYETNVKEWLFVPMKAKGSAFILREMQTHVFVLTYSHTVIIDMLCGLATYKVYNNLTIPKR